MTPSSTICVSQEGPANALALNKDATQVVIAGRNVFKVFSIGENEFTEVCNLRVGKNLNLNFSSIDVAWSAIEENTLATAATNGAVVVWNLSRSGRSKQEHVFSDHKRTVNKVSFHLAEPSLLISGSQDGMMKCFDLRIKEVARTFISNTESIRDVQFSPHQPNTFAAVSENGSVQLWDVRRHERCLQQFTAHSGPVFACDWHPDMPWLATASRDKTIKVWEIRAKPNLEHTIYTIASVGHVKWRPQKKWQVASGALVLDCAVHVWDVRRPHVPLATFADHRDVTTCVAWHAPNAFLATSRDCNLYRHRWAEAAHPVLWGAAHAAAVSARGALAHAAPQRPLPRAPRPAAPAAPPHAAHHPPPAALQASRKQPLAGSLSPAAQAALERAFPGGAASVLTRHAPLPAPPPAAPGAPPPALCPPLAGSAAFVACAKEYKLRGAPPQDLAAHNAAVARKYNRHLVAHVFDVVRLWIISVSGGGAAGAEAEGGRDAAPPRARSPRPAPPPPPPEEPWSDARFSNSGVLGLPTHSIYIPKQCGEDECGWISAASVHYVDEAAASWTLRECGGGLPAPASPPPAPAPAAPPAPAPLPASPGASSDGSDRDLAAHLPEGGGAGAGPALAVAGAVRRAARVALAPQLAAALQQHSARGDVQTPVTAALLAHAHRNELLPYIEESMQEQWLLAYISLLQRHKLWNVATEVIQLSWVSSVWATSQQSTSVVACCGRCGRRAPHPPQPAARCPAPASPAAPAAPAAAAPSALLCAVCRTVVRGLYAWCQGCSHGGHLAHMQRWMTQHQLCPAGCGHRCQLG